MALHFTAAEFARRRQALLSAMAAERLDALFLFQQESMFWLTGYDTFGFCFFQCLVVRADGTMALLTCSADLSAGAAHLEHRRHPHLEGRARRQPGRRPAGAGARSRHR